jgi:hypothetical protein
MSPFMAEKRKRAAARCPECGSDTVHRYRPFCSRRCADVDLARWLRGAYAIAGGNTDADDDGDEAEAFDLARRAGGERRDDDGEGGAAGGGSRLH